MLILLTATVLAGCASRPRTPAPVDDRSQGMQSAPPAAPAAVVQPVRPPTAALPEATSVNKPGYYTVRPGDTIIRIALDAGQTLRDIVRWNGIDNPNVIEVGQVLRVSPPPAGSSSPGGPADVTVVRPVTPASGAPLPPAQSVASEPRPAVALAPATVPVPAGKPAEGPDDDVPWAWPTLGAPTVVAGFDEARNKGLDIAGKAGDPVLASADGRVVYAGAGLRGYGNLIILKHNNTYLTAYAHNQTLLVKEDQSVRKGQKIAEMGNSDADRVKLHFEIRRQGKPVDPSRYLPR